MEGLEDSQPTGPETSATRRAVDLARLINDDCNRLLELYVSGYYSQVMWSLTVARTVIVAYNAT